MESELSKVRRFKKGFTLVEILCAVTIILILLGVAIKYVVGAQQLAQAAAAAKIEDDLNAVLKQKVATGSVCPYYFCAGSTLTTGTTNSLGSNLLVYLSTGVILNTFKTIPQGQIAETSVSKAVLYSGGNLISLSQLNTNMMSSVYQPATGNFVDNGGNDLSGQLITAATPLGNQNPNIVWYKIAGSPFDYGFDSSVNPAGTTMPQIIHIYVRPTAAPGA